MLEKVNLLFACLRSHRYYLQARGAMLLGLGRTPLDSGAAFCCPLRWLLRFNLQDPPLPVTTASVDIRHSTRHSRIVFNAYTVSSILKQDRTDCGMGEQHRLRARSNLFRPLFWPTSADTPPVVSVNNAFWLCPSPLIRSPFGIAGNAGNPSQGALHRGSYPLRSVLK